MVQRLWVAIKTPDQSKNDEVLMALRMLTRLLPLAFNGSDEDDFERTLFWDNKIPELPERPAPLLPEASESGVVAPALDLPNFDGLLTGAPLAQRILDILVRLMFLPNFTIVPIQIAKSENLTKDSEIPYKYAWAPGTFTKTVEYYNQTWQFDNHRLEVVLAMLAALSRPVYSPPQHDPSNPWLDYLTLKSTPFTPILLASLMNVSMRYDPVGWGVPYNHVLSQDVSEQLMNVSLELLSVILEHKSTIQLQPAQYQQTPAHQALHGPVVIDKPADRNVFIELLERLGPDDFTYIFNGVIRILNNPVVATHTYLPNSTKSISCQQEMLAVFWQLMQLCRPFLMHIMKRDDFIEVIYPVLYFIYQGRKDTAQMGQVHLGVFFLLYLSGERDFSIALNRPFNKSLIIDIPKFWNGSYADYLVLVLIQMIADGHKRLDSLWECMLTVLTNISPYLKNLTIVTSTRLLKLFVMFSKRSWLLSKEKNHRFVFFLLETFNNILQYQFEGNTSLVYSIISYKDYFFKLLDITKPQPVHEEGITHPEPDHPEPVIDTSPPSNVQDAPASSQAAPSASVQASSSGAAAPATVSGSASAAPSSAPAPSGQPKASTEPVVGKPIPLSEVHGPQSHTAPQVKEEEAPPVFKWTQEWLDTWAPRLPIGTVIRFLTGILPQVEAIVEGAASDQDTIMNFLKKTTLVGILPVPHPILIRHYSANRQTHVWFLQYIWGVIFLRHWVDLEVFAETQPRLFTARLPLPRHRHNHGQGHGHKH